MVPGFRDPGCDVDKVAESGPLVREGEAEGADEELDGEVFDPGGTPSRMSRRVAEGMIIRALRDELKTGHHATRQLHVVNVNSNALVVLKKGPSLAEILGASQIESGMRRQAIALCSRPSTTTTVLPTISILNGPREWDNHVVHLLKHTANTTMLTFLIRSWSQKEGMMDLGTFGSLGIPVFWIWNNNNNLWATLTLRVGAITRTAVGLSLFTPNQRTVEKGGFLLAPAARGAVSLTVVSLNTNGASPARLDRIRAVLDAIGTDPKQTICLIQETKARGVVFNSKGSVATPATGAKSNSGGTAVIFDKTTAIFSRSLSAMLPRTTKTLVSSTQIRTIQSGGTVATSVYFAPGLSAELFTEAIRRLTDFLAEGDLSYPPMATSTAIVAGDFNAVIDGRGGEVGRALSKFGFAMVVPDGPTFWTASAKTSGNISDGSLLDLCFARLPNGAGASLTTHWTDQSDHCAIVVRITGSEAALPTKKPSTIPVVLLDGLRGGLPESSRRRRALVKKAFFEYGLVTGGVETGVTTLTDSAIAAIAGVTRVHQPLVPQQPKGPTTPRIQAPLWWNGDLELLATRQRKLAILTRRSSHNGPEPNEKKYESCQARLKKLTHRVEESSLAAQLIFRMKLAGSSHFADVRDLKRGYGILRKKAPLSIALRNPEEAVEEARRIYEREHDPAEAVIYAKIKQYLEQHQDYFFDAGNNVSFLGSNTLYTANEVLSAAWTMRKDAVRGCDGLHPDIFINLPFQWFELAASTLNTAVAKGQYPQALLTSVFRSIDKPNDPGAFRIICNGPALSKLFETTIINRIYKGDEEEVSSRLNRLFGEHQVGFLRFHGAASPAITTALLIEHRARLGAQVNVVSIDTARAFDTMRHSQILSSMMEIGLPAREIRFVASFLGVESMGFPPRTMMHPDRPSDRIKQRVSVTTGSVLGPYLYNLGSRAFLAKTSPSSGMTVVSTVVLGQGEDPLPPISVLDIAYADDSTIIREKLQGPESAAEDYYALGGIRDRMELAGQMPNYSKFEVQSSEGVFQYGIEGRTHLSFPVAGGIVPAKAKVKMLGVDRLLGGLSEVSRSSMFAAVYGGSKFLRFEQVPVGIRLAHVEQGLRPAYRYPLLTRPLDEHNSLQKAATLAYRFILGASKAVSLESMQIFLGLRDHAIQEKYMTGLFVIYAVRSAAALQGVLATRLLTEAWLAGDNLGFNTFAGYVISIFDDLDRVKGYRPRPGIPGEFLSLIIGDGREGGIDRSSRSKQSGEIAKAKFKAQFVSLYGRPRVPDGVVALGEFAVDYFAFYTNMFPDRGAKREISYLPGLCRFCGSVPDSPAHLAACVRRGPISPRPGYPVEKEHLEGLTNARDVIPCLFSASILGYAAHALLALWILGEERPFLPAFRSTGLASSIKEKLTIPQGTKGQPMNVLKDLDVELVEVKRLAGDDQWGLGFVFSELIGLRLTLSSDIWRAQRVSAARVLELGDGWEDFPFITTSETEKERVLEGIRDDNEQGVKGLGALCHLYRRRVQCIILPSTMTEDYAIVEIGRTGDVLAGTLALLKGGGAPGWYRVVKKGTTERTFTPSGRVL